MLYMRSVKLKFVYKLRNWQRN